MKNIRLLIITILLVLSAPVTAQDEQPEVHAAETRLIYEGVQDLWPYSFLNEKGEPDGFNTELIKLILNKLNIPFDIKIRPRYKVFRDLNDGKADLTIDLTTNFYEGDWHYGQHSITLFTISTLSSKRNPNTIRNFHDLSNHKVYVSDSSLCHYLMIDYGWEQNAIPITNMTEAILQMSTDEEGEIIWNTMSLKWMLRKFQIENLEITPVNMPHGECRFISNDEQLLHRLDSVFSELNSLDQLTSLQNKWFYPEREDKDTSIWVWYTCGGLIVIFIIFIIYAFFYQLQIKKIMQKNANDNRRLALIMETSNISIWTYDIEEKTFIWHNEFGQLSSVYTREEFADRYSKEDFDRINEAIEKLAHQMLKPNSEEEEITLNIKAKNGIENDNNEMRNFIIALSVLRRDKYGKPTILIGTKKDVTEQHRKEQLANEQAMRYWELFNIPMVGIMFFDKDGILTDINQKACTMYCCDRNDILKRHISFQNLLGINGLDIREADNFHASCIIDPKLMSEEWKTNCACHVQERLYNEFHLITVYNETNDLLGMFTVCHDVTPKTKLQENLLDVKHQLARLQIKEKEYTRTINDFIRDANIRLASYSPTTHALTILNGNDQIQHQLTQTRIMTLVDAELHHKVMNFIGKMDDRKNIAINFDIKTTLYVKDTWLYLHIHLLPQVDKQGNVTEYIGFLHDISEQNTIEQQLALVEAKTQEVEETKTKFVNNMVQEIQRPMENVIRKVNELSPDKQLESDDECTRTIVSNADMLTHIIDNILNLSRLEAHMVETINKPTDFAMLFTDICQNSWEKNQMPDVKYIIENPYDQLVVDIDAEHLQNAIMQVALNAAQHTHHGTIRARYDYIGHRLMISIEDTGDGMTTKKLAELNHQLESGRHTSTGLGLPICKELLKQMGGDLEINSEEDIGTTVWITLPCVATAIKRKKII